MVPGIRNDAVDERKPMARYPLHLTVPSRSCERCKWWHLHPRQNFEVPTKFGLIFASMVLLFA
ncbi:MAG: hypothetical protein WBE50_16740, partial [Methyloceanibacter sp.]